MSRLTLMPLLLSAAIATPTITVDEIEPGMKGYGLSVFSGNKVERFEVEVIDVMHDAWPDSDMILARCTGKGLENTGIIAGMSGSPVYFDDRLAGAVAYGWNFSKEPIGGITPIEEMLAVWDIDTLGAAPSGDAPAPSRRSGYGFSTLSVPVALSGYRPGLADIIGPTLEDYGLLPVAATGARDGSAGVHPDSVLVPGGPVGVILADGDVKLSAIGTVTHREGNRILGFGHPMFQAGTAEIPMSGGIIHTVMPSVASSFKLFSTTDIVGTVTQDRLPAIGGVIGPKPAMLPVTIELNSPTVTKKYSYDVLRMRSLSGIVAAVGIADIVYASQGSFEEMSLDARMTVGIEDTVELEIRHRFSGEDPAAPLFQTALYELNSLFTNRFRPVRVTGIEFDLDFRPGDRVLTIEGVRPARKKVSPGEELAVKLDLRDQDGRRTEFETEIPIPRTAPEGVLRIAVASSDSMLYREAMRVPSLTEPSTLSGLLRLLERTGRENSLVIAGYVDRPGLTIRDRELPAPPASLMAVLGNQASDGAVGMTMESPLFRLERDMDAVVSGVYEIELEVRR